jgi:two-component sensor histidine kinase
MSIFEKLDLFSVYLFSITINLLVSISLTIFYYFSKKKERSLSCFTIGYWLLTGGMVVATFRTTVPDFIVEGFTGPLFISGVGIILAGFTALYNLPFRRLFGTTVAVSSLLAISFLIVDTSLPDRLLVINTVISVIFIYASYLYGAKWRYKFLRSVIVFSVVVVITLTYRSLTIVQSGPEGFFELSGVEKVLMFASMLYTNLLAVFIILGIGFALIRDSARLSERNELLMKEMNHRISNNLNSLLGMIQLEGGSGHPEFLAQLSNRLFSISNVHQFLYSTNNLEQVNLRDYLPPIVHKVMESFNKADVKINLEIDSIQLDADGALHLALITNELVINSCKYAFGMGGQGELRLEVVLDSSRNVTYLYTDSGPGKNQAQAESGFGSKIIEHSARYLEGVISEPAHENYHLKLSFPLPQLHLVSSGFSAV